MNWLAFSCVIKLLHFLTKEHMDIYENWWKSESSGDNQCFNKCSSNWIQQEGPSIKKYFVVFKAYSKPFEEKNFLQSFRWLNILFSYRCEIVLKHLLASFQKPVELIKLVVHVFYVIMFICKFCNPSLHCLNTVTINSSCTPDI